MPDASVSVCSELLSDTLKAEMEAVLADQYENTVASDGIPPYQFNWPSYDVLQQQGNLLVVTARQHGGIAGFLLYIVCEAPHHKGMLVAECDGITTARLSRGQGIASRMLDYALPVLRQMGVDRVIHKYRHVYDTVPLFVIHGFRAEETVYTKRL